MSKETQEWLEKNIRIGDTDLRGDAWWYRGVGNNHFPGAVPLDELVGKGGLFDWQPVVAPVFAQITVTEDEFFKARADGLPVWTEDVLVDEDQPELGMRKEFYAFYPRPRRRSITASDDYTADFSIPTENYQPHAYGEWLVDKVTALLDGNVDISSAGLLQNRAQAWVELGMDEVKRVGGYEYRPHFLAYTSLNNTLMTNFTLTNQATVCDNTFAMARSEDGPRVKVKHTKGSTGELKVKAAQEALGLLIETADDFGAEIEKWLKVPVSGKHWNDILNAALPLNTDENGEPLSLSAQRRNESKRGKLTDIWSNDEMAAPWKGTGWGVLATFNTYRHHHQQTRTTKGNEENGGRAERNMIAAINGTGFTADLKVKNLISQVVSV